MCDRFSSMRSFADSPWAAYPVNVLGMLVNLGPSDFGTRSIVEFGTKWIRDQLTDFETRGWWFYLFYIKVWQSGWHLFRPFADSPRAAYPVNGLGMLVNSGPSDFGTRSIVEFGTKWIRDQVISGPEVGDFGTKFWWFRDQYSIVFSLLKFHILTFIFQKFYKGFDPFKYDCLFKDLYTHNYRFY